MACDWGKKVIKGYVTSEKLIALCNLRNLVANHTCTDKDWRFHRIVISTDRICEKCCSSNEMRCAPEWRNLAAPAVRA